MYYKGLHTGLDNLMNLHGIHSTDAANVGWSPYCPVKYTHVSVSHLVLVGAWALNQRDEVCTGVWAQVVKELQDNAPQ